VAPLVNPHLMTTRVKRGFWLRVDRLTLSTTSASTLSPMLSSVHAALIDPNWRRTMEEEFATLITTNTSDLVPRPVGSNIITDKWIFMHKLHSDCSLEWYKAHWVLRGFTQRPGVDYDETFSPMVKPAMVHTVLSLAISRSWPVHRFDVKNVFLHNTLSETVYCSQPTRFVDPTQPDHVCLLNKSLYGLKQVPQTWYNRFAMYITSLGFVEAKFDTSLFVFWCSTDMIYLLLYVDDIVLTASSASLLQQTISALKREFAMKDLGSLHHFLGVFIQHQADGLFLTQRQFALDILERAGMVDCKSVSMPVDT
jgi:hypothetical protein